LSLSLEEKREKVRVCYLLLKRFLCARREKVFLPISSKRKEEKREAGNNLFPPFSLGLANNKKEVVGVYSSPACIWSGERKKEPLPNPGSTGERLRSKVLRTARENR
jgi:hypothetical protein